LSAPDHAWPAPEAGQIGWCHFPESKLLKAGRKPRPALVLTAFDDDAPPFRVVVAYGTSQKTQKLYTGEFLITPDDNEAFRLAGLSFPTKFCLASNIELPYTTMWFSPPPGAPHGQTPKLGVLHPALLRRAAAAWTGIGAGTKPR
jgi:mRNA-degrading endonuclease toxin of MazEF toxin-antitoxin module